MKVMAKNKHIPWWQRLLLITAWTVMAAVLAVAALLMCVTRLLQPEQLTPVAQRLANQYLDADVTIGRVALSSGGNHFLCLDVDSLTIISRPMLRLDAARRDTLPDYTDTLLTVSHFDGGISLTDLIMGNITLSDIAIDDLRANVYQAADVANFGIYRSEPSPEPEEPSSGLPQIAISHFSLRTPAVIRYLDDSGNVFSGRQKRHSLEYRARNKYGDYVICTCSGIVQKGTDGEPDFFVGTLTNHGIIDTVDPVTNLYNIYEFNNAIQSIQSSRTPAMVLMIGINHFHFVNDVYDYVFGNKVLYALAQAIQKEAKQHRGTVYRMDGAKFALCLWEATQDSTRELYESLRRLASDSLTVEGTPVSLSISGGAVYVEKFSGSEFPIISSAAYALDLSKRERHSELVFFDNELGGDTHRSMELLDALRQDIVNGCQGFYMVYQPLVQPEDGRVSGMEALLRWKSPVFGEVTPGRFIPVLEKDACFFTLGNWLLRQALTEAKPIVDRDPHFFLNVNIAYTQIERRGFRDSAEENQVSSVSGSCVM